MTDMALTNAFSGVRRTDGAVESRTIEGYLHRRNAAEINRNIVRLIERKIDRCAQDLSL